MSKRLFTGLFAILVPVFAALRYWQLVVTVDPANGFYLPEYLTLSNMLGLAMVTVCTVVILVMRFVPMPARLPFGPHPALGVVSLLTAAGFAYDTFEIFRGFYDGPPSPTSKVLLGFVGLLSVVFFVLFGLDMLKNRIPRFAPLCLLVLIWSLVRMVVSFVLYNGVHALSENVLDILAYSTAMIFWLCFARILVQADGKKGAQWVYGFGFTAAAFALMTSLPRLVALWTGHDGLAAGISGVSYANLSSSVFIFVFLLTVVQSSSDSDTTTVPTGTAWIPTVDDAPTGDPTVCSSPACNYPLLHPLEQTDADNTTPQDFQKDEATSSVHNALDPENTNSQQPLL